MSVGPVFNMVGGGGASPKLQTKTAAPSTSSQSITADEGYDGLSSVQINSMNDVLCGNVTITNNTDKGLIVRYDKLKINTTTEKYYLESNDMFVPAGTSSTVILIRKIENRVYVHNESETKYPIISSHSSSVAGSPLAISGNIGTPAPWTNYYSSVVLQWNSTDATETIVYGSIGNV